MKDQRKIQRRKILLRLIGIRVREAREAKRYSQLELSKKIGYSRVSISNIEVGRQALPVYELHTIALLLGVDIRDLIPSQKEIAIHCLTDSLSSTLARNGMTEEKLQALIKDMPGYSPEWIGKNLGEIFRKQLNDMQKQKVVEIWQTAL